MSILLVTGGIHLSGVVFPLLLQAISASLLHALCLQVTVLLLLIKLTQESLLLSLQPLQQQTASEQTWLSGITLSTCSAVKVGQPTVSTEQCSSYLTSGPCILAVCLCSSHSPVLRCSALPQSLQLLIQTADNIADSVTCGHHVRTGCSNLAVQGHAVNAEAVKWVYAGNRYLTPTGARTQLLLAPHAPFCCLQHAMVHKQHRLLVT